MPSSKYQKMFPALALCILVFIPAVINLSRQSSQFSPTPSPSPSPSPTQTPAPKPTPSPVPGAQNFHQWGSITLFNGLPSDSVRAIAQTPDGVMWFGTDNGLARFDGRTIQKFSFGNSDSDHIQVLATYANDDLWVATQNGAFVYHNGRLQPIAGTGGLNITAISVDRESLFGTDMGLLLQIELADDGTPISAKPMEEQIKGPDGNAVKITSLAYPAIGQAMAIGTSGLGVLMLAKGEISKSQVAGMPLFANALAFDKSGHLCIGADAEKGVSGIYSIGNGSRAERIAAPTANVLALNANENGLWAGTERFGLFRALNSKVTKTYTFENTSGGLRSNTIYSIFTDREGVVWIGTNRGVSRFDPTGPIQQTVSDSPNSNFIRTLWESGDGRAKFAGSNRGMFSWDGDKWNRVTGFGDKAVYAIGTTMDETVIGTSTGIFDSKGKLVASGDTRSLEMFQGETFAAVVGRGVIDITSGKQQVVFQDETARSLLLGSDRLWIGTAGHGLSSFDGRTVKTEVSGDILKSGTIWKIFEGENHGIWIAGEHGVFRFQNGQVEQIIAAEDVRDVFVDGPDVWAATTTHGLLHARHDERFGWLSSPIGFEQGLPSEKAFSIIPVQDGLLVATNRGVVTYYPHTIAPKLIPVRVLSQRMHEMSELVSPLALDYPQNSLLVEVSGLSSRTFPEEFQYSFTLRNGRGEIADAKFARDSQYAPSDLPPGDYAIEAIAFDRDLNASEPLAIRFSIAKAPFPWTATALGILLIIALIAFIWAMIERRHIALRNSELAAARFDLANEAERERSRIARDLHDQTLADLRNLLMMSDRLSPPNAEFRSEIESVSTEIRRICEDLSPSVLENVGLVAALEFLLSRSVEDHKFTTSEDANERIKFPVINQLHIYRIAQEILTNIKRHSDATRVEMNVEVPADGQFLLTIRDDATAFDPDAVISKGRGISNIRSRASLINAKIAWAQNADGGNIFSLEIAGKSSV